VVAAKELLGGIAEYLIRDCCISYELFVGCSTGSLLMPHLALGKIDKIKGYTSVGQKDILISALSLSRKLKMVLKQNQPLQYDTHVFKRLSHLWRK
jgi:hypothetical protein